MCQLSNSINLSLEAALDCLVSIKYYLQCQQSNSSSQLLSKRAIQTLEEACLLLYGAIIAEDSMASLWQDSHVIKLVGEAGPASGCKVCSAKLS